MLQKLIAAQNRRNWHPYAFLAFCAFVGLTRGLLEVVLQSTPLYNTDILNFIPFYILLGLLLTALLAVTAKVSFQSVQKSLTMGLFIGLFPPLFDFVFFGNRTAFYGYYYLWDFKALPYLGYKPEFNFPPGETLAIWVSILFCGLYVFAVSRGVVRSLVALAGAYAIFIFMGSLLPIFIAKLSGAHFFSIEMARMGDPTTLRALAFRIAFYQCVGAVGVYLMIRRELLRVTLARLLHIVPFAMLTILGGIVVGANTITLTQSTLLIALVAFAVLVQNDYFDAQNLLPTERPRAPQKYDVQTINVLVVLAILPLFFHNNRAAIAAALAFCCGLLYNYPFYRARNYFPANLKIEGVWGLTSFLAGALAEPHMAATGRVVLLAFLVFGGWSTVAVLKDLKDTASDAKEGVQTLFTIFMRRGYSVIEIWSICRWVLICFILLPLFLTALSLPLWATIALAILTLGIVASFWWSDYRKAFRLQLALISVYILFWQVAFSRAWL